MREPVITNSPELPTTSAVHKPQEEEKNEILIELFTLAGKIRETLQRKEFRVS